MDKMEFNKYGGTSDFFDHKEGAGQKFNEVSGGDGHVDPYGDEEKKEKDAINMNAAMAFNKKDYTKIEANGTDYPKKSGKPGQFSDNKGDHFKVESVTPEGDSAAKTKSGQTVSRK